MRNFTLIAVAVIVSMATCSQSGGKRASGNARDPYEIKQSVFFDDGSLDEFTTSAWDSSYQFVANQERYSASGAMLEQIEYTYLNDNKDLVTTKITRDVERRLKNRVVYKYNEKSNRLIQEAFVDNKGKIVSSYEYLYDAQGNRTGRIIKNRAGDKLAETTYTFQNGRLVSSKTRDYGESAISSTEYSYDTAGNLVRQLVKTNDGRTTATINAVWQDGQEIQSETLGPDGKLRMRITNEYGSNGELVKKTVENFQGDSKQILEYEYIFRPARRQS